MSTAQTPTSARYAVAVFQHPQRVLGTVRMIQPSRDEPVHVFVDVHYLVPGQRHGMHVHEYGDVRHGCASAGGHYDPAHTGRHGGGNGWYPDIADGADECQRPKKRFKSTHHAGDLENNLPAADAHGSVTNYGFVVHDRSFTLFGDTSAYGCSVVIHDGTDDEGRGANASSRINGNAGPCRACAPLVRCSAETAISGKPHGADATATAGGAEQPPHHNAVPTVDAVVPPSTRQRLARMGLTSPRHDGSAR